jgi:hypothetical protein
MGCSNKAELARSLAVPGLKVEGMSKGRTNDIKDVKDVILVDFLRV